MVVNQIADYYNNTIANFNVIIEQNIKIIKNVDSNKDNFNDTIKNHLSGTVQIAQRKKNYYSTLLEYTQNFKSISEMLNDLKSKQLYCYQLCRDKFFDIFYTALQLDFLNEKEKIKHTVNFHTAKNNKPVTAKFIRHDIKYLKLLNIKDIDKYTLYDLIMNNYEIIPYVATHCRAWQYFTTVEIDNIIKKYPNSEKIINNILNK